LNQRDEDGHVFFLPHKVSRGRPEIKNLTGDVAIMMAAAVVLRTTEPKHRELAWLASAEEVTPVHTTKSKQRN
jgi:hypothetical protein